MLANARNACIINFIDKATTKGNKMNAVIAQNGNRVVRTCNQNSAGVFESRLYVNKGETATLICAKHKTLAGAQKWAAAQVAA
jgi:hypothetical protein